MRLRSRQQALPTTGRRSERTKKASPSLHLVMAPTSSCTTPPADQSRVAGPKMAWGHHEPGGSVPEARSSDQ